METMSNVNSRSKRIKNSFSRSSKILMSLYTSKSSMHQHQHPQHQHHQRSIKSAASGPAPAPAPAPPPSSAPALVILNHQDQLQVYPQKVALVVPDRNRHHDYYSCGKLETYFMAEDDEAVDAKAAKYITDVQARFRSA